MPHEKFMISPRKFGPNFCESYLKKYHKEEENNIEGNDLYTKLHNMLHTKRNKKKILIDYNDFLIHIIEDLLLKEAKSTGLNIIKLKEQYFNFIDPNLNPEDEKDINQAKQEIKTILNDTDTQRIIRARYGYEVLGIAKDETRDNNIKTWRILIKKFVTQGERLYKFDNQIIYSKIGIKFITDISRKINSIDKDNTSKEVNNNFNWQTYINFIQD